MKTLLVVDCQYDFIYGTLACQHAPQAIKTIIQFINHYQEPLQVLFLQGRWRSQLMHLTIYPNAGKTLGGKILEQFHELALPGAHHWG